MEMIDIKEDVPWLWGDDITFCLAECTYERCPRNSKNIRDKTIPHSYCKDIPKDCPIHDLPSIDDHEVKIDTDNEKVIKGLEKFKADFKPFCGGRADWKRIDDAIAMLKKQEAELLQQEAELGILRNIYGQ